MGSSDETKPKPKPKPQASQYKIMYEKYIKNQKGGAKELDQWENQQENGPVAYYETIVKKYGEPDIKVNQKGGL